jgi:hypothetical protein
VGEAQPGGGSPRRRGSCGGPPGRHGGSGGRPRKAGGGGCGNLVAGARSRQWRRAPPGVFLFFLFLFFIFWMQILLQNFFPKLLFSLDLDVKVFLQFFSNYFSNFSVSKFFSSIFFLSSKYFS